MSVTVAYFTSRKNPHIEWFFSSLYRELGGNYEGIRVVVVDFWAQAMDGRIQGISPNWTEADVMERRALFALASAALSLAGVTCLHVPPKPTVWAGPSRLTKENYFAAANARNTAICLAPDGWIVGVDDVSVLMPGWWKAVQAAIDGDYVVCGAYRKVKDLVVENGNVVSFTDFAAGHDHREAVAKGKITDTNGGWFYGCSFAAPVEALLQIGGFMEICDGMGFEDVPAGLMMKANGWELKYDPRMLSYESEEAHFLDKPMIRIDPVKEPTIMPATALGYPEMRNDKSHALLRLLWPHGWRDQAIRYHPGYFGPEGIRGLRKRVLAGEAFPKMGIPEHCWFSGVRLTDL